jgi:hypothetical protein
MMRHLSSSSPLMDARYFLSFSLSLTLSYFVIFICSYGEKEIGLARGLKESCFVIVACSCLFMSPFCGCLRLCGSFLHLVDYEIYTFTKAKTLSIHAPPKGCSLPTSISATDYAVSPSILLVVLPAADGAWLRLALHIETLDRRRALAHWHSLNRHFRSSRDQPQDQ